MPERLSRMDNNMTFRDLEESALKLNELYEQIEIKRYGRVWTTEEIALGFVGDVGDLAKLIQANAGVCGCISPSSRPVTVEALSLTRDRSSIAGQNRSASQ